MVSLDFSST